MQQLIQQIEQHVQEAGGTWGIAIEDLNRGETWQLNGDQPFYAASIIKLPIMAAVYAAAARGDFRLSDFLTLKQDDLVGGSGVLQHLTPGIRLPIADYVMLMIIQSDNTATNMLIDLVGTEEIQKAMKALGMENSTFYNKLMTVPVDTPGRNMITAADVTKLLSTIARGRFVSWYACEQMIAIMKKQQWRDGLPAFLPDEDEDIIGTQTDWEVANKTGWMTGIRHDAAIFYVGRRTLAVTTLSKDCDDWAARVAMAKIGKAIYEYLKKTQ
jgi:beta-lactamase class A